MSENVNNQYDFFKLVNLDADGNLGVVLSGDTGGGLWEAGTGTDSIKSINTTNPNTVSGDRSVVLNGKNNTVSNTDSLNSGFDSSTAAFNSSIVGGNNINIDATSMMSNSFGGFFGSINNSMFSQLIGGSGNNITNSQLGTIINGQNNTMTGVNATSGRSIILGGAANAIDGNDSAILGGGLNVIDEVTHSVILGGLSITATQDYTAYVPNFVIKNNLIPTSTSDTAGEVGQISHDATYIYVKTTTGWGRVALDYTF